MCREQPGPRLPKCPFPQALLRVLYQAGEASDFKAGNEPDPLVSNEDGSNEERIISGTTNWVWNVS